MGASDSLQLISLPSILLYFTRWKKEDINNLLERSKRLQKFTVNDNELLFLFGNDIAKNVTSQLYHAIFEHKVNKLADKLEILSALILISSMSHEEKLHYIYNLFCFNIDGYISLQELLLMFSTILRIMNKIDYKLPIFYKEYIEKFIYDYFWTGHERINRSRFVTIANTNHFVAAFLNSSNLRIQVPLPSHQTDIAAIYRDSLFPAVYKSIIPFSRWQRLLSFPPIDLIQWKDIDAENTLFQHKSRKSKLFKGMEYYGEGCLSSGYFKSGILRNTWLINAFVHICPKPHLINKLFISTLQEKQGRICVQLFDNILGWKTYFIDDCIPFLCTILADQVRPSLPLFCHSSCKYEWWPSLLEKVFAKECGSYAHLDAYHADDAILSAIRKLTGGHVLQKAVQSYRWSHTDLLHISADTTYGTRSILNWLKLGGLVSLCLKESTAYQRSGARHTRNYADPPAGRLFPVIDVILKSTETTLVLIDKWAWKHDRARPQTLYKGMGCCIFVSVTDIIDYFDTIVIALYPDLDRIQLDIKLTHTTKSFLWNSYTLTSSYSRAKDEQREHMFEVFLDDGTGEAGEQDGCECVFLLTRLQNRMAQPELKSSIFVKIVSYLEPRNVLFNFSGRDSSSCMSFQATLPTTGRYYFIAASASEESGALPMSDVSLHLTIPCTHTAEIKVCPHDDYFSILNDTEKNSTSFSDKVINDTAIDIPSILEPQTSREKVICFMNEIVALAAAAIENKANDTN